MTNGVPHPKGSDYTDSVPHLHPKAFPSKLQIVTSPSSKLQAKVFPNHAIPIEQLAITSSVSFLRPDAPQGDARFAHFLGEQPAHLQLPVALNGGKRAIMWPPSKKGPAPATGRCAAPVTRLPSCTGVNGPH